MCHFFFLNGELLIGKNAKWMFDDRYQSFLISVDTLVLFAGWISIKAHYIASSYIMKTSIIKSISMLTNSFLTVLCIF